MEDCLLIDVPEDYEPTGATIDNLYTIAMTIKKSKIGNKMEFFSQKLPNFTDKFKSLMMMATDQQTDLEILDLHLKYFVKQIKKRDRGGQTQERASENVGHALYGEFVKPKVGEMGKNI
jgi:hypothetical protein